MTTINLEGLSLTTLSDYTFPSHTRSIDLDDNYLTNLSNLPTDLQGIRINNNNLGLTGYFGFTGVDGPTGVTGVTGPSGTTGYMGYIDLSPFTQLVSLDAINCNLTSTLNFSTTITAINLMHNNISDISEFSLCVNLRDLILDNNIVSDISGLPITLRKLTINNNMLTSLPDLSLYSSMSVLQIKNNPITTISTLPKFVRELNISGTEITDFAQITKANVNIIDIKYNGKDLSTLGTNVSKFNIGGDIKEKNTLSYINIFYTDSTLYDLSPIFMTINTIANEWTQLTLNSFNSKCSNKFLVKNNSVYYYGDKYGPFTASAQITLKGTNDLVRIVGIKNKEPSTTIDYTNSIITVNELSGDTKTITLNFLFMLNTGDYVEIYIKTGINNTLTVYSFNLMIDQVFIGQ